jgi:hypothetical protein
MTRSNWPFRNAILPALLLLIGAVLQLAAYWPGLLHTDSTYQLSEAVSGVWDDWHSPLMSWIWRQLLWIHSGPAPFFVFQAGLYWSGFALLTYWASRENRWVLALLIAAIALLPLSLATLGSILKDCIMTGFLLCATGLLALTQHKSNRLFSLVAILFLFLAAGLRSNAFLAALPLLVMLLPSVFRRTPARLALTSIVGAVVLLATMPVANKLLGAKKSDVNLSLIIFDLGGITKYSGVDVFPQLGLPDTVKVNDGCYTPRYWDSYGWWVEKPCTINFNTVRAAFQKSGENPYVHWVKAIISHPIAYTTHRLSHFNLNTRFMVRWAIKQPVWNESRTSYEEFRIRPNPILHGIDRAAFRNVQLPVGWPIWWLAVTAGVLILSPGLKSRDFIVPVGLSAFLYGSGYIALSVALETRYHMWTIIAALLVAAVAADDLRTGPRPTRRRLLLAAAPVVLVTILGFAARLYLQAGMSPAV